MSTHILCFVVSITAAIDMFWLTVQVCFVSIRFAFWYYVDLIFHFDYVTLFFEYTLLCLCIIYVTFHFLLLVAVSLMCVIAISNSRAGVLGYIWLPCAVYV